MPLRFMGVEGQRYKVEKINNPNDEFTGTYNGTRVMEQPYPHMPVVAHIFGSIAYPDGSIGISEIFDGDVGVVYRITPVQAAGRRRRGSRKRRAHRRTSRAHRRTTRAHRRH